MFSFLSPLRFFHNKFNEEKKITQKNFELVQRHKILIWLALSALLQKYVKVIAMVSWRMYEKELKRARKNEMSIVFEGISTS